MYRCSKCNGNMKFEYTEGWNGHWVCVCCGSVSEIYTTNKVDCMVKYIDPRKEIEKVYIKQQEGLEEKRRLQQEIEQVSNKLSELLSYVTGGRFSKTSYTIEDMKRFADDYQQVECAKCELQMGEWSSEEG